MKATKDAIDVITTFEGWSSEPYLDPIGIPTIGYGSIWDINGDRVTMEHIPITKEHGQKLLEKELCHIEQSIKRLVNYPLNQSQFDALCSFIFNVGSGNFQRSTMRMKLNRGNYENAANEFPKWRRAGGKILKGLVRRRAVEQALFRKDM